jgi:hypothetical protein
MSARSATLEFRRLRVLETCWMLTLVVLASSFLATSIKAASPEPSCLIKIEGAIYDIAPCNLNEEDGGVIRFGHLNLEEPAGYWVSLTKREDGRYDGFWNDDFGANHAHTPLGVLTLEDRAAGECFSNRSTLLCRNIPPDTPVYDVKFRSLNDGGNTITAYLDGIEYEVPHPNWDYMQPYTIEQSGDLDGDGHLEALIRVGHGGNCCPADISILSYRGGGFFTYLDSTPILGGWGGAEIVMEAGQAIVRIHDGHAAIGNIQYGRAQRDYAIINGTVEKIAERTEYGGPSQVVGLGLEEVQSSAGQQKELSFDIDQDGQMDVISCKYWERWGVLNCVAEISGTIAPLELQCQRVSVSPSVFGPRRSHRLLCDQTIVDYK